MRRLLSIGAAVAAFVVLAVLVAAAAVPKVTEPTRIHVIEHATTDVVIDTDQSGSDTTGDLLTWHNVIFDASDAHHVGRDQGDCIRINVARGTWECRWVTWVAGGSLTVEGPFYDTHDSVLAITGGTGAFRNARGSMLLKSRNGGTEYDFIFAVEP
jgi:allene oxide cyclase